MTREERAARDVMRRWLAGDEMVAEVQAAYRQLIAERNHVIVNDAMNRIAGKVKDMLEATGRDGGPLIPPSLSGAQLTEFIELLRANRGKK